PWLAGGRGAPAAAHRPAGGAHHRPGRGGAVSAAVQGPATPPAGGDRPPYSLGIDLGTTHCALSWVDGAASDGERVVQGVLDVPQLAAPGSVEAQPLLPSFLYLPHEAEFAAADLALPGQPAQSFIAGALARARGAATPIRLVAS